MIRVSLNKTNDKKLCVRFKYDANIIAKLRQIPGAKYVNKTDDKHWTIDYFKIKNLVELFGEDEVIIDNDVNVNYKMLDKYNFNKELDLFMDHRFRSFATWCLTKAPANFFVVPSSYIYKDMPEYAKDEGGLSRHTAAVMRITYAIRKNMGLTDKETDVALAAALIHDFSKFGYEQPVDSPEFDHPLEIVDIFDDIFKEYVKLNEEEQNPDVIYVYNDSWSEIRKIIRSSEGVNNEDKDTGNILPLPKDKLSKTVALANELASQNFIEINFRKRLKPGII